MSLCMARSIRRAASAKILPSCGDDAEQMQRIGLVGQGGEHLVEQRLRLVEAAGLLVLDGEAERIAYRHPGGGRSTHVIAFISCSRDG